MYRVWYYLWIHLERKMMSFRRGCDLTVVNYSGP